MGMLLPCGFRIRILLENPLLVGYDMYHLGRENILQATGIACSTCHSHPIQKRIPDSDSTENSASGEVGYIPFQAKKYF